MDTKTQNIYFFKTKTKLILNILFVLLSTAMVVSSIMRQNIGLCILGILCIVYFILKSIDSMEDYILFLLSIFAEENAKQANHRR